MKSIPIPYYRSHLTLNIDETNLLAVLTPQSDDFKVDKSGEEIIRDALQNPIGSDTLANIAKGKQKVLLVTSDHTRAVPSKVTLPLLLAEIRKGSPDADITIIISTGLHRATTAEEQRQMFGDAIVDSEHIVVHDAFKDEDMEFVCALPSGANFVVNRRVLECDLLLTEGFIEPHFFAGFSGGRKSILPGLCSAETVNENHSFKAIDNANAASGVLEGNPIHEDMVYAAKQVIVQFTLNVALDSGKNIIGAFAGDLFKSHEVGCEFVKNLAKAPKVTGDIVVTSNGGYPLDQNLYQAPKAISTGALCAGEDGVIIMAASCVDGMGGTHFEELMFSGTVDEILATLSKIPPKETIPEQWCAQIICRILKKHKVIIVTTNYDHEKLKKANLMAASSLDEAMEMAYSMKGRDAKVVVIPDGVAVLPS